MTIEPDRFRDAWPQVVRALAAATGSIDEGEELAAEAFARAAALPDAPASLVGWCIAVGRRAAIDAARRRATERAALPTLHDQATRTLDARDEAGGGVSAIDDRVALLVVACDDLLPPVSRMVLAMRLVLGVDVDAIAAHLGLERAAAAARLTRAKRTLAEQRGAFAVPVGDERERRMPVVLDCVHGLVAIGQRLAIDTDDALGDLVGHAERLAEALVRERPRDAEARAVLAIARLALARRPGRVVDGVALAPEDVDRRRWDARRIGLGVDDALAAAGLAGDAPGRYALESRVAALHTAAPTAWAVPWPLVARLHGAVEATWPAPSATLSRHALPPRRRGIRAARRRGHRPRTRRPARRRTARHGRDRRRRRGARRRRRHRSSDAPRRRARARRPRLAHERTRRSGPLRRPRTAARRRRHRIRSHPSLLRATRGVVSSTRRAASIPSRGRGCACCSERRRRSP